VGLLAAWKDCLIYRSRRFFEPPRGVPRTRAPDWIGKKNGNIHCGAAASKNYPPLSAISSSPRTTVWEPTLCSPLIPRVLLNRAERIGTKAERRGLHRPRAERCQQAA